MTADRTRPFHGWAILVLAAAGYGLGLSPAYYGWGYLLPAIIADLHLSRQEAGQVFGLFTFLMSAVGPLVGLAIARLGIRSVMASGSLVAAVGFVMMSRAESVTHCYVALSLVAALGIGFATMVPCQALGANWFRRRRALALSVILATGGVVGKLVPIAFGTVLAHGTWRQAWLWLAALSTLLAITQALFIRDRPEDIGETPDGDDPDAQSTATDADLAVAPIPEPAWAARAALRTPQFAAVVACAVACLVPWVVVVTHGRLHLADRGLPAELTGGLIGTMALVSVAGRLLCSIADHLAPTLVLAFALAGEAAGVALLAVTTSTGPAYLAVVLLGLGFGASYSAISVVLAKFYGRTPFPTVSGARLLVTALFMAVAPGAAGAVADRTGSYGPALTALAALAVTGAVIAALLRAPTAPPAGAREAA